MPQHGYHSNYSTWGFPIILGVTPVNPDPTLDAKRPKVLPIYPPWYQPDVVPWVTSPERPMCPDGRGGYVGFVWRCTWPDDGEWPWPGGEWPPPPEIDPYPPDFPPRNIPPDIDPWYKQPTKWPIGPPWIPVSPLNDPDYYWPIPWSRDPNDPGYEPYWLPTPRYPTPPGWDPNNPLQNPDNIDPTKDCHWWEWDRPPGGGSGGWRLRKPHDDWGERMCWPDGTNGGGYPPWHCKHIPCEDCDCHPNCLPHRVAGSTQRSSPPSSPPYNGPFKLKESDGTIKQYYKDDIVTFAGKTYKVLNDVRGKHPASDKTNFLLIEDKNAGTDGGIF